MRLSVVLPAYNEAQDLPPLLARIVATLGRLPVAYRIIVIDDGSTDATASVVRNAALTAPVELVQHPRNLGLGAALRTGLTVDHSAEDVIILMDADNSHDPELIPALLKRIEEGYDVVIASRFQLGGEMVGVPWHRLLLSTIAGYGLRILFRLPGVRDYSCGYRAYRGEILNRLNQTYGTAIITENDFAGMLELLVRLGKIGARFSEIPLILRYDLKVGASKMKVIYTMARYVAVLRKNLSVRTLRGLA